MKSAVLVLGATGSLGRGVVAAAVEASRPVIAVARDSDALAQLKAEIKAAHPAAELTVMTASVATEDECAQLATLLREHDRPLSGVIATMSGGAGRGRLLDQSIDVLQRRLDEDLLPHLAAARHLLPLLVDAERGGSYVLIGGPGSERPWAGYGYRSIAAAALRMLACVLHDEARSLGVRVQLLAVDSPVCNERNRAYACPQWPDAIAVGRRALGLIDRSEGRESATAVVPYASASAKSAIATQSTSQLADSNASLLPTRCLQDARKLLTTVTSLKYKQEPQR